MTIDLARPLQGKRVKIAGLNVRDARMAAGLCVDCGRRPPPEDRILCRPCLDGYNARTKARYYRITGAKPRKNMICGLCGGRGHDRRSCSCFAKQELSV